jgi:pimeloyl-ACP methyl ester carboxylesterase
MEFYRDRLLKTWMTEGAGEASLSPEFLRTIWAAKSAEQTEESIARLTEPGALTGALNWYRASRGHKRALEDFEIPAISVPTLLIRGRNEAGQSVMADAASLMAGEYRVAELEGGHFIVDEQPQLVAEETLAHLLAHPIR